jgi:hypothetical protein
MQAIKTAFTGTSWDAMAQMIIRATEGCAVQPRSNQKKGRQLPPFQITVVDSGPTGSPDGDDGYHWRSPQWSQLRLVGR